MYGGLSFGQTADYCEGDDCPEKLTIEGFDVRISPNVYSAPDFTNTLLGQHLETHTHLSFTLHELWRTDPETYSLIWNAWHDPDGFCEERRWRLHQNWTDDPVSSVESR